MNANELRFHWFNRLVDPSVFLQIPTSLEIYMSLEDFLAITGIEKKRFDLYLFRHKEIRTKIESGKKFLSVPEVLFYLAKLQRSKYGKKEKFEKESPENW